MTSTALDRWRSERADLLDGLFDAHGKVGGMGAGRRWTTSELNKALLLRVAAQFQGFAKDLHTETAITFGLLARPSDPTSATVIATGLQVNRELDRGNAHEAALTGDFERFGIELWREMENHHSRTAVRRKHLRWFNAARNGLAHDDGDKIGRVEEAGYRINLVWIRRWRSALDGLGGTMDEVLAVHLSRLFKTNRPW